MEPDPALLTNDSHFYDSAARALVDGRGYIAVLKAPAATAHYPPGYPAILAAVYLFPGPDVMMGKLLNAALGAATCTLVFALGRLAFSRAAGVAGAFVLTLFPSHIFQSSLLMTEVFWGALLVTSVLLVAWAMLHGRLFEWRVLVPLGLLLGAASLVRGETLLLPLVFGLVWVFTSRAYRRVAAAFAITVLAMAVIVGGWTIRNAVQLGSPVLISTGVASTFSQTHWEGADGGPEFLISAQTQSQYEHLPYPEREVTWYRETMRDAFVYMTTHPRHELSLIPKRFARLMRHDHAPLDYITKAPYGAEEPQDYPIGDEGFDRLRLLSDVYYFAAIGFALAGSVLCWRRRREIALLLLAPIAYVALIFSVIFVAEPRYHASMIPLLSVLAAPAVVALCDRVLAPIRRRSSPPGAAPGVVSRAGGA